MAARRPGDYTGACQEPGPNGLPRIEAELVSNGTKPDTMRAPEVEDPLAEDFGHLRASIGRPTRYANPAALGLFAFGFTTALLQGATTKIVELKVEHMTFCFALFYGGLIQLLAGMWEFPRGNMFGAVAFSSYGGFWMGWGLYGILVTGKVLAGGVIEGTEMMLALWGIFTFLLFLQTFAINRCLQILFFLLSCTFFLLSAGQEHPNVTKAGGWFGLATAATAFYTAFAELTNDTYGKVYLPLGTVVRGKVIAKRTADGCEFMV